MKIHRTYTVDEAAELTTHSKGTIRRWIKDGGLPAIADKRPLLILGHDLADFIKARARRGPKLALHQCYCLKCRQARSPALEMADYIARTPTNGNLRALCEVCTTIMHKAIAKASLPLLEGIVEITITQAGEHLIDPSQPRLDDHFERDRKSHG